MIQRSDGYLTFGIRPAICFGVGSRCKPFLGCVSSIRGKITSHLIKRKQLRTSLTNVSGCSKAAKWPPLVSSLKYTSLANLFSAHRFEVRKISLGKIEQPTGTATGSVIVRRKLSQ